VTTEELAPMAQDIYDEIKSRVSSPRDAACLVLMLHVIIWLNYREESSSTEDMLADYNKDFLTNFKRNLDA
jgi:hypothetical protein